MLACAWGHEKLGKSGSGHLRESLTCIKKRLPNTFGKGSGFEKKSIEPLGNISKALLIST